MTSPDRNVESVRQKMLDRSQVGLTKYGTTTERTDIDFIGWLNHMQQELMDGAIYAQAAMAAHADTGTLEQEVRQVRARLARVEKERDEMLAVVEKCSAVFAEYTDLHLAKRPPDIRKAERNNGMHERCEAAIASMQGGMKADDLEAMRLAQAGKDIDVEFAHTLAFELECMLLDPNTYWDSAAKVLDDYKAAWEKINPMPPLFMGEPVPPERKAIYARIKAQREAAKVQP